MKHLLLIAFLSIGGYCSAQVPPAGLTKQANESAILAGKAALNAKITALQAAYSADPTSAASIQTTQDVYTMIRQEMLYVKYRSRFETDPNVQRSLAADFIPVETAQNKFHKLAGDPGSNHAELLKQAKIFQGLL